MLEGAALGGQRVLHAYRGANLDLTRDQPPRLQLLEARRQGLGPDAVLDRALGISLSGEIWGLAALAAGLIGGAVPLLARKTAPASTAPNAA